MSFFRPYVAPAFALTFAFLSSLHAADRPGNAGKCGDETYMESISDLFVCNVDLSIDACDGLTTAGGVLGFATPAVQVGLNSARGNQAFANYQKLTAEYQRLRQVYLEAYHEASRFSQTRDFAVDPFYAEQEGSRANRMHEERYRDPVRRKALLDDIKKFADLDRKSRSAEAEATRFWRDKVEPLEKKYLLGGSVEYDPKTPPTLRFFLRERAALGGEIRKAMWDIEDSKAFGKYYPEYKESTDARLSAAQEKLRAATEKLNRLDTKVTKPVFFGGRSLGKRGVAGAVIGATIGGTSFLVSSLAGGCEKVSSTAAKYIETKTTAKGCEAEFKSGMEEYLLSMPQLERDRLIAKDPILCEALMGRAKARVTSLPKVETKITECGSTSSRAEVAINGAKYAFEIVNQNGLLKVRSPLGIRDGGNEVANPVSIEWQITDGLISSVNVPGNEVWAKIPMDERSPQVANSIYDPARDLKIQSFSKGTVARGLNSDGLKHVVGEQTVALKRAIGEIARGCEYVRSTVGDALPGDRGSSSQSEQ